jgi:hypothetical protein
VAWTVDHGETELALRYTVALWRYWRQLGEFAEGSRWSNAALALDGEGRAVVAAKALWGQRRSLSRRPTTLAWRSWPRKRSGSPTTATTPMDLRKRPDR